MPLTRTQLLLCKLAEEASEIGEAALASLGPGLMAKCPGQPHTNAEHIHHEIDELYSVVEMLNEEAGFGYRPQKLDIQPTNLKTVAHHDRQQAMLCHLARQTLKLTKVALKTQQFGLTEICLGQNDTNAQRTHHEIDTLGGIIKRLNDDYGFGYQPNEKRMQDKKQRINHYAAYANTLGQTKTPT